MNVKLNFNRIMKWKEYERGWIDQDVGISGLIKLNRTWRMLVGEDSRRVRDSEQLVPLIESNPS